MRAARLLTVALSSGASSAFLTPRVHRVASPLARSSVTRSTALLSTSSPVSIVVEAEIEPSRLDEFKRVIEEDAVGSREEPGCLRFDVVQSSENEHKFYFYEVYTDEDAVAFHKAQPHFALWSDFKASGGVVHAQSHKGRVFSYSDPLTKE